MALLDCPDEQFKGALASKVSYDQASRELSITVGTAIFAGKMTADGKASRHFNDGAWFSFSDPFRSLGA